MSLLRQRQGVGLLDDGLVGHGFAPNMHGGADLVARLTTTMLSPILMGRDPFHIRGLWDEMFWRTQILGRTGANRIAMAAVDIAKGVKKTGTYWGGTVVWQRNYPVRGPRGYRVVWKQGGHRLGPPLTFYVPAPIA